jgi:hypothetical protein
MTQIQVLGPLRRSMSVRHIDGALVVNVEGDVRPLIVMVLTTPLWYVAASMLSMVRVVEGLKSGTRRSPAS